MALYIGGQEVSKSSGVPIKVEGLTGIDSTTPTSLNGILKGNGSTIAAATAGIDYSIPVSTISINLPVASWTGSEAPYSLTASVSGATANNLKIMAPDPTSIDEYAACGVRAAEEQNGTIIFKCLILPENNLQVNIAIFN